MFPPFQQQKAKKKNVNLEFPKLIQQQNGEVKPKQFEFDFKSTEGPPKQINPNSNKSFVEEKQIKKFTLALKQKTNHQKHRTLSVQQQTPIQQQTITRTLQSQVERKKIPKQFEEYFQELKCTQKDYSQQKICVQKEYFLNKDIFAALNDDYMLLERIMKFLDIHSLFLSFSSACRKARNVVKTFLKNNSFQKEYNEFCKLFLRDRPEVYHFVKDKMILQHLFDSQSREILSEIQILAKENKEVNELLNVGLACSGYSVDLKDTIKEIKKLGIKKSFKFLFSICSIPSHCSIKNIKYFYELSSWQFSNQSFGDLLVITIQSSIILRFSYQKRLPELKQMLQRTFKGIYYTDFEKVKTRLLSKSHNFHLKNKNTVFNLVGKNQFHIILSFLSMKDLTNLLQTSKRMNNAIQNYLDEKVDELNLKQSQLLSHQNINESYLNEIYLYLNFALFMKKVEDYIYKSEMQNNTLHRELFNVLYFTYFKNSTQLLIDYSMGEYRIQQPNCFLLGDRNILIYNFLQSYSFENMKRIQRVNPYPYYLLYPFLTFLVQFTKKNLSSHQFINYFKSFLQEKDLFIISAQILYYKRLAKKITLEETYLSVFFMKQHYKECLNLLFKKI